MFAWIGKLFRQTVAWFRPDNGHAVLTIPVHPSPPPSAPVNLGPSLSAPVNPGPPPAPNVLLVEHTRNNGERRRRRERDHWLHPVRPAAVPRAPRAPRKPRSVVELAPREEEDVSALHRAGQWDLRRESEDSGVFYFRGALLDRLDHYFHAVARMKKAHRDAYEIYTRVGGVMIPVHAAAAVYELPSFWRSPADRPAFGCVHFGGTLEEEIKEDNMLQLLYFEKMSEPGADIEPAPGCDVYEVSAYLDDLAPDAHERINKLKSKRWRRWLRQCGFVFQFWIAISPGGEMRPLKTLQSNYKQIDYRSGDKSLGGKTRVARFTESIPYRCWDYPYNLRWWWKEYHENAAKKRRHAETLEEWACSTLRLIANFAQASEFAVRIAVENTAGHNAVFALDWKRTAYFFKDRDVVFTPKGGKARIFHIVKPHMRKSKGGGETAVHLHFRGLRRFKWGDYAVHITVPGLHHMPLTEWTVGMAVVDAIPPEEREGLMDAEAIGRELAAHLDERKTRGQLFR